MNLYVRLIWMLIGSRFESRSHHSTPVGTRFRVLPHDLDAFGHMNNGRYLQIMDVARVHWMLRTGVASAIRRNRWAPLLGGGFIRYRHALRLWQTYDVRTRLLGWDEKWFFFEHTFVDARGRCVAVGINRAALRQRGEWVKAATVAGQIEPGAVSPDLPHYVNEWLGLEEIAYRRGRMNALGSITSAVNEEVA